MFGTEGETMLRAVRLGVVLAAITSVIPAAAENKDAARQAYAEGSKYYDLNQFAEALEAFKRAYWNFEEPSFLFNIAQCHRALGHKREAIDFYRSYLRKAPNAANRADVEKLLSQLEDAVEKQRITSPSPSDSQPQISTETRTVKLAAPAPNTPRAAISTETAVALPAKRPVWKRGWFWALVGGGVLVGVAVGAGVGVGLQPHSPRPTDGVLSF